MTTPLEFFPPASIPDDSGSVTHYPNFVFTFPPRAILPWVCDAGVLLRSREER